jgi:hypothetical protein
MAIQTRNPTGNGYITGWSGSYASVVDYDGSYIQSPQIGTNYYALVTFSAFSVPVGSTISVLTVYYYSVTYTSNGGSWISSCIDVNGSYYNDGGQLAPLNSYAWTSVDWTTNPATESAWTVNDINGSGSHPLQQFGVYGGSVNHAVLVEQIYATVTYTDASLTIGSGGSGGISSGKSSSPSSWGSS